MRSESLEARDLATASLPFPSFPSSTLNAVIEVGVMRRFAVQFETTESSDAVGLFAQRARSPGGRATGPAIAFFTDPQCDPCRLLLPEMARWQQRYTDHLTLALVRSGDLDANRERTDPIGLSHVRLYRETENEYPHRLSRLE